MARRTVMWMVAAFLAVLIVPVAPAAAGGGCHQGVTQGDGGTVEMIDACFTPTILQVDPGETVTFVNTDPMTHNVTANVWGYFEDLNEGDAFTATFDQPGIYPYACAYHPGMTGAIVVGSGTGAGNGETVSVDSVELPQASPVVRVRTVTQDPSSAPITIGWIAGAALGLALGLGIGFVVRKRSGAAG
jgi:plastocyanin